MSGMVSATASTVVSMLFAMSSAAALATNSVAATAVPRKRPSLSLRRARLGLATETPPFGPQKAAREPRVLLSERAARRLVRQDRGPHSRDEVPHRRGRLAPSLSDSG